MLRVFWAGLIPTQCPAARACTHGSVAGSLLAKRQASRHTEVRFVRVTSPAAGLLELPS